MAGTDRHLWLRRLRNWHPAAFSSARLSLLDRGVIFAIAHVRGGGELGRNWYEQGRLELKQNTFSDLAVAGTTLCVRVGLTQIA